MIFVVEFYSTKNNYDPVISITINEWMTIQVKFALV